MTIVHFSTELTGGAGMFVRHVHEAMLGMGMDSVVCTREKNDLPGIRTVRPMSRIWATGRARGIGLMESLGIIRRPYALFGMEPTPVVLKEIQHALADKTPRVMIFYWLSYFISFETIRQLQQAFTHASVVLVCLDEALLTGACHYSYGCTGATTGCHTCPGTTSRLLQQRISSQFQTKQHALSNINALLVYPTSTLQQQGSQSLLAQNIRHTVLPLGAISQHEFNIVQQVRKMGVNQSALATKRLLVRSSSEYRKGCDLFITALQLLQSRRTTLREDLEVISIGDSTLADASINRWVNHSHKGYVDRAELLTTYQQTDALIVTSREDAGPVMINECVALGIFVISTPIGVAPDLLNNIHIGLIANDISAMALAQAMETWLSQTPAKKSLHEGSDYPDQLTFEGYTRRLLAAATKATDAA